MKKIFLYFLVACVTSITISQITNNINTYNNNFSNPVEKTLNKDEPIITKLNEDYASRTDELNNKIKKNLIDSIILVDNHITINYQNLNHKLYSDTIYQTLLSSEYLNTLKIQYQFNLINFDENNHINFNINQISNYNSDAWGEWHWYWFAWWKLHLSYNMISKIIQMTSKWGGPIGPAVEKISKYIAELLSTAIAMATAIIIAGFIILSYVVILGYSDNVKGCWIGMLSLLPGVGWGSN